MHDILPLSRTPLGLYRHFKGGKYEVIDVVRHSETLEPRVLYRPPYRDTGLWVRPHKLFFEQIVVDATSQARFALVAAARD